PALEAEVSRLDPSDLLEILPTETPVKLGKLAQQDFTLNVDISLLQNNLLICSDSAKNTSTIVLNFAKQLENNAESCVIFNIDGKYKDEKRFVFGENFKMPLNFDSINFIYANDLNDIDATSKAVIQDIFLEVQEYTRSIPDKFIPFDTFINVVEQQYAESNIPELALLKNKLLRYREEKVFAQSKYEITSLKEYIKDNYTVILDISMADAKLQKEIITYVYSVLDEMGAPITTFVKFNDENSDKKLIRTILNESSVYTNVICNHNYKFVYELKEQADNLILFIPETTRHDFPAYNTFLNKLNHDEFIVWGKATQRIPLIVELSELVIKMDEPIKITMEEPAQIEELPEQEEIEEAQETEEIEKIQETVESTSEANKEQQDEPAKESVVIAPLPAPVEDFTQNEDTYTDLSDDIERIQPEDEDYSAIQEAPQTVEDLSEEDDFDKELDDSIEESLVPTQDEEALTNNFFTEDKLQDESEVEAVQDVVNEELQNNEFIPQTRTHVVRDASSKLDIAGVIEEEVPNVITEHRIQVATPEEIETDMPLPKEVILEEESYTEDDNSNIIEEFQPEETYEEEDEFTENEVYMTSEPSLQVDESLLDNENMTIEEETFVEEDEALTLPDPTIDERIEEDLPEVEALFEELPPDEEVTPYENTMIQEPAQLMPDANDELIEQVAREVDETFIYNKIEEDNLLNEDSLTEDDLNFIDDITLNDNETLEEDEYSNVDELEQIQTGAKAQNSQEELPIYPAQTPVSNQTFEPGDHVAHPKYGEGIVEKMVRTGKDKVLCSINFANHGRRLLDPAISEISLL
ncbi:hypothetical protein J6A31_02280, partial [bacterium]|nr:hypothetical protein [bacterium]